MRCCGGVRTDERRGELVMVVVVVVVVETPKIMMNRRREGGRWRGKRKMRGSLRTQQGANLILCPTKHTMLDALLGPELKT